MVFNYAVGSSLTKDGAQTKIAKKNLLIFGIISNVVLLAYFKYTDFFISNFNFIFDAKIPLQHLMLPLAISFFTFQQVAYLIDSYKGDTKEYDFLNYALFVTFFPQLIAGPIVHHKEMMPQFANIRNKVVNYNNIIYGFFIFSIGLFKKVVVADTFAVWASAGFDKAELLSFFEAWSASLSYTFQLYFDFSGYTDMAIGAALLFNIVLPINFNSPYKSLNIQDFWRRWHITLSRFLKDYIYIPLGGNRTGSFRTFANLMITFVIGGLWHGAGWTFVFWGFLHGLALALHRIWRFLGFKLNAVLAWFITFNFLNISWIFFRAKSWNDAFKVLRAMFSLDNIVLPLRLEDKLAFLKNYGISFGEWAENINGSNYTVVMILGTMAVVLWFKNSVQIIKNKNILSFKSAVFYGIVFGIAVIAMSVSRHSEFIYFNF